MPKYYPPKYHDSKFHCPHCQVFAAQTWGNLFHVSSNSRGVNPAPGMEYSICTHCSQWSYWYLEKMVVPPVSTAPPPHGDMPKECLSEYQEARAIVAVSPRAAAALLRLALQKLMSVLGESGRNINEDVGNLVKKGLPVLVQQALDICRVVGNNAVHPGEIELNDTPETAHSLFDMMNLIVEDRIARPRQVEVLYNQLPEGARQAIEARDKKTGP